jgi:hypothetical protein
LEKGSLGRDPLRCSPRCLTPLPARGILGVDAESNFGTAKRGTWSFLYWIDDCQNMAMTTDIPRLPALGMRLVHKLQGSASVAIVEVPSSCTCLEQSGSLLRSRASFPFYHPGVGLDTPSGLVSSLKALPVSPGNVRQSECRRVHIRYPKGRVLIQYIISRLRSSEAGSAGPISQAF